MATRKIRIRGYNHAVNSATTVTFDGVEVFSGAVVCRSLLTKVMCGLQIPQSLLQ